MTTRMLVHQWTPPSPIPASPTNEPSYQSKQRTCLRWSKCLVSATIPLILIGCFLAYFFQRETFFDEHGQREDLHRREDRYQAAFDAFVREVSDVLLRASDEKALDDIRGKTLTILRDLDEKRKERLILFLSNRDLLQVNRLDLRGADLRNVALTCPDDFHHLHLPGVIWSRGRFNNCRFISAVFDGASLDKAQFINCTLQQTSFLESNLAGSHFQRTFILNSNFHRASLVQADFLQMNIIQGSIFSSADLFEAKFTDDQWNGKGIAMIKHDFQHARFPNGSFDTLETGKNLLLNADAENEVKICLKRNETNHLSFYPSAHRRRKPIGIHRTLVEPSSPRSVIPTHICGATVRLSFPVHYECIKQ